MDQVEKLFLGEKPLSDSTLCDGCTVLKHRKPVHSIIDYASLPQADVLFLSDSFKHRMGKSTAFSVEELEDIIGPATRLIPEQDICFSTAVKCPSVSDSEMSADDKDICRQHLSNTIDKVKPKVVFPCGNFAMKMLTKKSGITNKRGTAFDYSTDTGYSCIVVPIYHPFFVIKEPRHRYLFDLDIRNAYNKYVLGKDTPSELLYELVTDFDQLSEYDYLLTTEEPIAIDIETTGLNFLTDTIMTISLSCQEKSIVLPIHHKDSPLSQGELVSFLKWLSYALTNPSNKKVFHNAKFDLKFLKAYGLEVVNVWDTKIMSHLVNENIPKSLKELVKIYFPQQLESL